jgi:hypothetical protein
MHSKVKDRGFVVLMVRADPLPEEPESNGKEKDDIALRFLKEQKIPFTNYRLDELEKTWKGKLGVEDLPCVYVFNRAGQYEKKYAEKPNPAEIDALADKLLKEKAPE